MKSKITFLALFISATVFAIGPKVPSILSFTLNPASEQVTGYWFYWAVGTVPVDTQRIAVSTNSFAAFDLRVLNLPQGDYNYWLTATNINGGESGADMLPWHFHNPNKPFSTIKTP
jgi:hypothetical protein